MRFYDVTREIAAPADRVWAVLTDPAKLAAADTGVIRVEGQIAHGERIKVWSMVSPKRAFPVTVTVFDSPRLMEWTGGMPLGLFRGVRRFSLDQSGTGTRLRIREEFTGPLLPLIWRTMPDLTASFEQFVAGVADNAEGEG